MRKAIIVVTCIALVAFGGVLLINNLDYIRLKNAPFFAYGNVGYAGETPKEHYAFRRLLNKENALYYFSKLERSANNEGKLYALCGLYYLDYDSYGNLMEKYGSSDEMVRFMSGCIISDEPISEIIKNDDRDGTPAVRLRDKEDTIEAWFGRNNFDRKNGYIVDFYGGSIPYLVKNG